MQLIYIPTTTRAAYMADPNRWHLARAGALLCGAVGAVVAPPGVAAVDEALVCEGCLKGLEGARP